MATSDVLSFSLHQPLWKNLYFKDRQRQEGRISDLSTANGQWRRRTLNYWNQRPDLCSFHNHRTPLRTLQSACTQMYSLQWKPASAGVGGDRLLCAPKVRSKLTLAKDTGGKLLVFSKAMALHGCKWPVMHSETPPQWTAGNFHQEDEVQTTWAVALWKSGDFSEWAPQHWPSSEAKFILMRERKLLTVARLSWSRTNKNWRNNRSGLLCSASREKSGFYYKIPAWSFLPQDRPRRPRLVWINQK